MLTIKQRNVLCALEQHDGRLSLRMPCQRFGWLSTSTPQDIVAQLVARGFVRRLPGHTGVEILRSAETVVWRRQRYFRFDATSKKLVEFTPAAGVACVQA
jgi:hypothetical protein